MALGAALGGMLGHSIGQQLIGGAMQGQGQAVDQNGNPYTPGTPARGQQQQPKTGDPLLDLMKKHLAGAMPGPTPMGPTPMGPSPANPGYDGASGGTA